MSIEEVATSLLFARLGPDAHRSALLGLQTRLNDDKDHGDKASVARLLLVSLRQQDIVGPRTVQSWRQEALQSLTTYVLNSIRCADGNLAQLSDAAVLCSENEQLLKIVLRLCIRSLLDAAWAIDTQRDGWLHADQEVGPQLEAISERLPQNESLLGRLGRSSPKQDLDGVQSMLMIQSLAAMRVSFSCYFFHACELVMLLSRASSHDLLLKARETLLALLTPSEESSMVKSMAGGSYVPTRFPSMIWQVVNSLTSSQLNIAYTNAGYAVWLRTAQISTLAVPSHVLHTEDYWRKIHTGLSSGTSEEKKYCLAILHYSIERLDQDIDVPSMALQQERAEEAKTAYAKYAALYETIVLSRYLNQVQASLPDLWSLVSPDCPLHGPWIVTLLHAALSHGMQDSIRKVLGTWTMDNSENIVASSPPNAISSFLEDALLPWATLGYHHTSSMMKHRSQGMLCTHGEKVSQYLQQVIVQSSQRLAIVQSILAYLAGQGGRMFPFGRAYILNGILMGTEVTGLALDEVCVDLIVKIAAIQGFQGMVQDLMTIQCHQLTEYITESQKHVSNLKPLQSARAVVEEGNVDLGSERDNAQIIIDMMTSVQNVATNISKLLSPASEEASIARFADVIRITRHQCLWGGGLAAGVLYVRRSLKTELEDLPSQDDLTTLISALWDEAEIQDYPRDILKEIPNLFFHETIVSSCEAASDLSNLLGRILLELQNLAQNRAYIFTPLARALSKISLDVPAVTTLPVRRFLENYANTPPVTRIEFVLEKAMESRLIAAVPKRTYESYYGKDASYGHACVFHLLNRLPSGDHWDAECRVLLDAILTQWINQKQPVPVFSRWKTTTHLQIMLLCVERLLPILTNSEIETCLQQLFDVLALEPLPRLRYLLEWIVVRVFVRLPNKRVELLRMQNEMDFSNPKYLVSIMKLNLMLACLPDSPEEHALELMTQLIPLSASSKIVIRHEAQWTFCPLWEYAVERGWDSILANRAFERLNRSIRASDSYKRPPTTRILERFHPVRDHNLTNLTSGGYLYIEPQELPPLQHQDLEAVMQDYSGKSDRSLMPIGEAKDIAAGISESEAISPPQAELGIIDPSGPLQTKGSAWQDSIGLESSSATGRTEKQRIILVASFIDNAFNLGGLSRLGEIFGVESLQIQNMRSLKSRDFTSVAVASHLWLMIEQLEQDKVSQYLLDRKFDGYTVVGIEQTDSSKVLGDEDCILPEKIILVLGSEREGIPAKVLAALDLCVEIRQRGVTRSMNVQTAAAVVLYEYSQQHKS